MLKDDVLKREIRAVMNQLCGLLSSSIALFNSPPTKFVLQSHDVDSVACGIKGHVILQEDTLCSMELMVKPHKTSPLIKSMFREDKQWKLQQIQDAINHLKLALNMISMFEDPSSIVNFYVLEDNLVITHYTVQQNHTQLTKSSQPLQTTQLFHPIGSIIIEMINLTKTENILVITGPFPLKYRQRVLFYNIREHSGSRYEIATAHRSHCLIPWLGQVVAASDVCLQLGYQLKEKLALSRDEYS